MRENTELLVLLTEMICGCVNEKDNLYTVYADPLNQDAGGFERNTRWLCFCATFEAVACPRNDECEFLMRQWKW